MESPHILTRAKIESEVGVRRHIRAGGLKEREMARRECEKGNTQTKRGRGRVGGESEGSCRIER